MVWLASGLKHWANFSDRFSTISQNSENSALLVCTILRPMIDGFLLGFCSKLTKHEDMADILEEYKQYVPSHTVTLDEQIPKEDVTEEMHNIHFDIGMQDTTA